MKSKNKIIWFLLHILILPLIVGYISSSLIQSTFAANMDKNPNVIININEDGSLSQIGDLFVGQLYPSRVESVEEGTCGINGVIRISNKFKKINVENIAIGLKGFDIRNDSPESIVRNSFLNNVRLKIQKGSLFNFDKILIDYTSLDSILYEKDNDEYRGYTLDEKDKFSLNKGDTVDLKYSLHMALDTGNELQSVTAHMPIIINLKESHVDDNGDDDDEDDDDDRIIIADNEVPLAELEKIDHFAYIIGYPEGNIRPLSQITREEVAMIFYRLLTDDSRNQLLSDTNSFTDIDSSRWSNRAISTLYTGGIISGYPDGTFRPLAPITRAELSNIASKFDKLNVEGASKFADIFGHWAEDYISSSENNGWIKGYPDMTFKPEQYITRAEAMTLINNVLGRAVPAENIHPDAMFWPDISEDDWFYEAVMEATNSHNYVYEDDGDELWTEMKPIKIWP